MSEEYPMDKVAEDAQWHEGALPPDAAAPPEPSGSIGDSVEMQGIPEGERSMLFGTSEQDSATSASHSADHPTLREEPAPTAEAGQPEVVADANPPEVVAEAGQPEVVADANPPEVVAEAGQPEVVADANPPEAAVSAATGPLQSDGRSMRSRLLIGVAALLAVVVASVAGLLVLGNDDLPSDAAFRVDDRVVTVEALARRVEVLEALYGVTPPTDGPRVAAFRRDTAKALVLSMVMSTAAADKGVEVGQKVVNDALDRIISDRYPQGGRSDFVKALAAQGVSEDDVRDELRRQLEVRQLYDQVTSGVTVSEAAAQKDFLAHPGTYQQGERRHLRELVVSDEATARDLASQVANGASFTALAKAHSLDASTKAGGGDLGVVAKDDLDPAFAGPAFAAAKGEVFGPVKTDLGWYVGFVEGVLTSEPVTFDDVKAQVRQRLEDIGQIKAWRAFLQRRLDDTDVVYASDYRPADPTSLPDSAVEPGSGQQSSAP